MSSFVRLLLATTAILCNNEYQVGETPLIPAGSRVADYYQRQGRRVRCLLCPFRCSLGEGQGGLCGVRRNDAGVLITDNYAMVTARAVEPIEKKPLYHFHPGHLILSVGSFGCNLRCDFCQNWELSQRRPRAVLLEPHDVLEELEQQGPECIGVAYTFSEPGVWFEFMRDTAVLIHSAGYKNVVVTNGFISTEPLAQLIPLIDAVNVDLKGFDDDFYSRVCGGRVEPVKNTISQLHAAGVHVEVTTLIIPDENDCDDRLHAMYRWLGGISPDIPAHVTRYFPDYQRNTPATSERLLQRAASIASEYLAHVYIGNLSFSNRSDTRCVTCGKILIHREGYSVTQPTACTAGVCGNCGTPVPFRGFARERSL